MKKKVIGFITLLLVLSLGLSINTYAFNSANEVKADLQEKLQTYIDKGVLPSTTNINGVLGWIDNSTRNYAIVIGTNCGVNLSGNYFYIYQVSGTGGTTYIGNGSQGTSSWTWYDWNYRWYSGSCIVLNLSNGNIQNAAATNLFNTGQISYCYTTQKIDTVALQLNAGEEFGNYYITPAPIVISFDAYNDGNISVFYNGTSDTFLKYNLSRSVPNWALGKLDGLSGDMRVDVKLNRYMNSEFTTSIGHAQWYGGQRTSFGGLSIAADGVVYIDNTKLYYNQGYYLTIDLEGENVDNYPLYFLPYASTATSGELLSPEIDTNSDLEILQNIQDLVNIQNIGAIYDNYFSGDSGDVLGSLGYNDYDNQYQVYMADILDELHTVLMTSGDVSVNVSLMGVPMTLHSSDYTVPNNAIKIFCNSFLTFGLFYYIYKTAVHFFHQLQEGNFVGAVNTYTVDDESVYM